MNTNKTKKTSGQNQTAPRKPLNKLFLLLTLLVLAATNAWAALPGVAPAAPTAPAGSVIALFNSSGTYTDISGINYYESWGGWASAANYSIPPAVLGYHSVSYGGIGFEGNVQNISAKTHLHVDLWTPNGSSFAIRLVSNVGGQADYTYTTAGGQITANSWLHLDMPISAFHTANPSMDLTQIKQMGLINNNPGQSGTPDYYIDNLYFYTAAAAPASPTGLAVTATGANSVSLSWNASTGSPITYNVKRSTTSGGTYTTVGTTTAPTTNYTDSVVGGSTYYYEVSAVNVGGESTNSSYVSASPTLGAPSAPAGLSASASDAQVSLSWTASVAATGYNVKRSTTNGLEVTIATAGTTSYTDSTVANGTTYYYEVSATNSVGESANSSEVSASPVAYVGVYEPFAYSAGSLANNTPGTGTGETGNWVIPTGVPTIVSPGLTYPSLPTSTNAYQHTATGNQNYVTLANSLSSGTKYISYLFQGSGDSGGDTVGVYFKGNNATSLFAGFHAPNNGAYDGFSLGSVSSTSLGGATTLGSIINISDTAVHLIVIEIDFNTSGVNDTVSLWIDPPAGTNSPGVAANTTVSTFDVGTISAIGINITGGYATKFDEFRTGGSYGSVVGAPAGAAPTTLALSVASGEEISWSANSSDYYQPQSSPDGSIWSNLGGQLTGSAVTSVYDPVSAAYHQVLQDTPVIAEEVQNNGFEYSDGGSAGSAGWTGVGATPPTRITTDFHTGAACESLYVTNATIAAQVAGIEQNVVNNGGAAIVPGNTYTFSFWAKSLGKYSSGGYVQQYNPQWVDGTGAIVGSVVWTSFTASTDTWTQVSSAPMVAPAGAVSALIQILAATGGIQDDFGGVLVDDVSLTTTSPSGSPTVIAATVQSGAVFTATVKTNGVTASTATGTVAFKTNSVAQSVGTVATGVANSTPTAVPAYYIITAIYSGDGTYLGSTNTLTVGSSVNTSRTNIVMSVLGNQLTLSWPADHTGWTLQTETNLLGNTWVDVAGSTTTNQVIITVNPTNPAVFYRMKY